MNNLNYTLKLLYCFSSYKISFGGRKIQIFPWALITLATTLLLGLTFLSIKSPIKKGCLFKTSCISLAKNKSGAQGGIRKGARRTDVIMARVVTTSSSMFVWRELQKSRT